VRVFVTGTAGFIGRQLVPRLERDGHHLTALLKGDEVAPRLGAARIVRGGVTRPASLAGLLDGHDAVVHLAGVIGYGRKRRHRIRVNRDGTANVTGEAVRAELDLTILRPSVI